MNNNCNDTPFQSAPCPNWEIAHGTDRKIINSMIAESINIGASDINVFKLLGIYQQGSLADLTGNGSPISNGDLSNFPMSNTFNKFDTAWKSLQQGNEVIINSYIGYDFGPLRLSNGRNEYGIETLVKKDISSIKIIQGCKNEFASKVRVERSNDGKKWYGVTILSLNKTTTLYSFKKSVPSRWWRIRPIEFNGGNKDHWSVKALQLLDFEEKSISNIQDRILLESRNLEYSKINIVIKGSYRPIDIVANASKYGFLQSSNQYELEVSFASVVKLLGRPIIIGDIIQLPAETLYDPTLTPVLKYLEINDVAWSTNGYTPQWKPTMLRLIAVPVLASQETQDIFGKLAETVDTSGLVDISNPENDLSYQNITGINDTIEAESNTMVPERGTNTTELSTLSPELLADGKKYNLTLNTINKPTSPYIRDALPPNNLPFTTGDTFPTDPKDLEYHRLTYTHIADNIPPRLYRYSDLKVRWVYLETDQRYIDKVTKPILQEFIDPINSTVTDPNREFGGKVID